MSVVGDEGPSKIRGEFKTTFDEINYGIPVDEALINLVDRVPTTDMKFFAAAVLLQRETGGNLAEILGNLSRLIRERLKLYGKIRVLSAEGKLSAWILTLLPFVVTGLVLLINPEFMSILWTDAIGPKLIAANTSMMLIGIFWMWRIVKIRV
jgi:tight adherence protein B